jgi:hypothetical protein
VDDAVASIEKKDMTQRRRGAEAQRNETQLEG